MFIYKGVFTIWGSSKILTQKGVFENFKRRGVLRKNLCKCTGIKNKYACIHYIMMFKRIFFKGRESLIISTPKRGVFENFERKKEGSLKIFEDPPFFSRGVHLNCEHSLIYQNYSWLRWSQTESPTDGGHNNTPNCSKAFGVKKLLLWECSLAYLSAVPL